ncbi:MAG: hypothetical protein IJS39_11805 [Synergistaceae bacterium]|nr:hypothetical protein [Synergistaceae bacterium]
MMKAGASAVQVGSANLADPFACKKIVEDLPGLCEKLGITRLFDIIQCSRIRPDFGNCSTRRYYSRHRIRT